MYNKNLGTIRLIVGNNGPRISVGTKVIFNNINQLLVGEYITSHGSYANGVWQIDLLDVGEYAEIYLEVDNLTSGQVIVECTIEGKYPDPNPSNNICTYYIGNTGVPR